MERVPIRTRESGVTTSAWRIKLEKGSIVMLEVDGKTFYRGEGALLGSTQEKLAELWQAALPTTKPEPENPPLG